MSDSIDDAQEREQLDRDLALRAHELRVAASFEPRRAGIDGMCIDCDEAIEPIRLKVLAGKTARCASCAKTHEQRMRGVQ
jgi:RNA polymerase-binding transcription factor DksA